MNIHWSSPGREDIQLTLEIKQNQITSVQMKAIGGLPFLKYSQKMKGLLKGPVDQLSIPEGSETPAMIWREIFCRIQGHWESPVTNEELCHCRKVLTQTVDEAIVYGAHDIVNIRKQTSANTGCATCLPDIDALLKHRNAL